MAFRNMNRLIFVWTTAVLALWPIAGSAKPIAAVKPITDFAFSFDIDGVLVLGDEPISGACESLLFLQENSIPFILLTNGGGKTEAARVAHLSEKIGVNLTTDNFVQSHTPFKKMVNGTFNNVGPLGDKTVLMTGLVQERVRDVAETYGFKKVVIPADIIVANPLVSPITTSRDFSHYKSIARPLPGDVAAKDLKVDAIMVFDGISDYGRELQIVLDFLLSENGYFGRRSRKNGNPTLFNNGWQQDGQPELIFSNGDFTFPSNYDFPRFAQGGFQAALKGIWNQQTDGAELKMGVFGKPAQQVYEYAEDVLIEYRKDLLGEQAPKLQNVYMIGDNPMSDIRGANNFKSPEGTNWASILVETGVYEKGTKPKWVPTTTVASVVEAVKWALEQEKYQNLDILA